MRGSKLHNRFVSERISLIVCLAALLSFTTRADSIPQVEWQRSFGGTNADSLSDLCLTGDGDFILCGNSRSGASGNKTSTNSGDFDGWVIALDANGAKLWDWSYGGTSTDGFGAVRQNTNGSFIAAGVSFSTASGNKTSTNHGSSDGWLVRFAANGTKLNDQSFGGTSIDSFGNLHLTDDGGCVAGGGAFSGVSGNKTSPNQGIQDCWVIGLNALGTKIWDVDLGGTGFDGVLSIEPTGDNGFIVGAVSGSGINGNKTATNYGGNDYWLIKLDSNGNKEWEKSFGGTSTDYLIRALQTPDGGYILGGYSSSGVSGVKTSPNHGGEDFWVVKLDSAGNKVWENTYGGNTNDHLRTLEMTGDEGYILGGYSASGVSGNKTSANYGGQDYWLVKIDANGGKLWELSFGGTFDDDLFRVQPLDGGGYLLVGTSYSDISGNKTAGVFGNSDSWCIKLSVPAPQLTVTRLTGEVILSWPSVASGFVLQQNTDLSTTNWTAVVVSPTDDGTNKSVTLPTSLQRNFYQLRAP